MLSQCVAMGREQAKSAENGAAVAIIGNTGAGKSTFVNYLHGCKMESVSKAAVSSPSSAAQTRDGSSGALQPGGECGDLSIDSGGGRHPASRGPARWW